MSRLSLSTVIAIVAFSGMVRAGEIQWVPTYEKAMLDASAGNKIVLLVFMTDKSADCTKFKQETLADPAVQAALSGIIPVLLTPDSPSAKELAGRFAIETVPVTVFLDKEAGLLGKSAGFITSADFIQEIKVARGGVEAYSARLAAYKDTPSPATAVGLVEEYLIRQQAAKVAEIMQAARAIVEADKTITYNQRMSYSARLHIAEAFSQIKEAKTPDQVLNILAKAEEEAALADTESAARAGYLRGVLCLEAQRLEEGLKILQNVVSAYPKAKWTPAAKENLDAVKEELARRAAEQAVANPPEGTPQPVPAAQ